MIAVSGYKGQAVGVLGMGRTGLATARALAAGGAIPICWDDGEAGRAQAAAAGFEVADLSARPGLSALIVSPGIPHLYPRMHPAIAAAARDGVSINNDVGLFCEQISTRPDHGAEVVLVTGSNGKSTTTALIAHMLSVAGERAVAIGNIGAAVLAAPPPEEVDFYVVEISSYQADVAQELDATYCVFTNFSEDHYDRHGGRGGYFAAKRRMFEMADPIHAAIGVDEPEGLFLAMSLGRAQVLQVTARADGGAHRIEFAGGVLREVRPRPTNMLPYANDPYPPTPLDDAPALRGAHNHQNAACAFGLGRAIGLEPGAIAEAFRSFPGLPHRLERIAEIGGVTYVNDSKATNADAAEKALLSYDRIRWIAGGVPKSGGIEPLRPHFSRVEKAYLIGEAAQEFAATLGDHPHELCGDLQTALAAAARDARPGETVLLAPACASFDQFASFEARGAAFRTLVEGMV